MAVEYSTIIKTRKCFHLEYQQQTVNNGRTTRSKSSTNTLYCPTRGKDDEDELVYSL